MQRKIFITGGAGFIGSAMVRRLIKESDYLVINYDKLTYAANLHALDAVKQNPRYTFIHDDICNQTKLKWVFDTYNPDTIIHFAAESHVDNSINSAADFINTNVIGTYNLLEIFKRHFEKAQNQSHYKFIHISTDEVYGDLLPNEPQFNVNSRYKPSSPYSASKASSDHLVHAWARTYKLPCIITHCSNNYGPFQHLEKFIPKAITNALRNIKIPLYGNGQNIRDWIYVDDHIDALVQILEHGEADMTYNIGGDNEIKNIDVLINICKILDEQKPRKDNQSYQDLIEYVPDRLGHDQRYAIDNTHITQQLGWEPKTTFKEGIEKTVEWCVKTQS